MADEARPRCRTAHARSKMSEGNRDGRDDQRNGWRPPGVGDRLAAKLRRSGHAPSRQDKLAFAICSVANCCQPCSRSNGRSIWAGVWDSRVDASLAQRKTSGRPCSPPHECRVPRLRPGRGCGPHWVCRKNAAPPGAREARSSVRAALGDCVGPNCTCGLTAA
jgi:hypothetical protein